MSSPFPELQSLFMRTKHAVGQFMEMISPSIEHAKDEHERLYWHHIYEEEEQRLDRLNDLLPKLTHMIENNDAQSTSNLAFIHLLQDISLEKFGLHNFEEHLDLALYSFKDAETQEKLQQLRGVTSADYAFVKEIIQELNQRFDGAAQKAGSIPTDEKAEQNHLKAASLTNVKSEKKLTVGSLKNRR